MAADRKSDRRRDNLYAGGLRKRVQASSMTCGLRAALFNIRRRPFIEDGTQSLAIESETESVFLCKLRDLSFPIFLVHRPQSFQVLLVNRAVLPLAMHLAFDLSGEHFHRTI
jgi:hypothetical protein